MTRVGWNPTLSANLTNDNMRQKYVIRGGKTDIRKLQQSDFAARRMPDGRYRVIKDRIGFMLGKILSYDELVLELL